MGFRQGDSSHPQNRSLAAWLLPGIIVGIAVVLAVYGDSGREWLRFDRSAVANGEYWRLVSGHFVHLGVSHLAWDAAGLLLIWYLVGQSFSRKQWLVVSLVAVVGIDLGFWFLEPNLTWYVGLSGLVHGLLAAGVVGSLKSEGAYMWILGVGLIAKLAYEALVGPVPGSAESSGGTVIVAAHVYGAVAGAIAAGAIMIRDRTRLSI
jgi:rhomboid family GlyGly-CTERM serine protease